MLSQVSRKENFEILFLKFFYLSVIIIIIILKQKLQLDTYILALEYGDCRYWSCVFESSAK